MKKRFYRNYPDVWLPGLPGWWSRCRHRRTPLLSFGFALKGFFNLVKRDIVGTLITFLCNPLCDVADLIVGKHLSVIKELWHGNIIPQEDSRTNSKEMKELLGYMSRHHEDLEKSFTDEQKEIFEKFHDCWDEYIILAEAAIFEYAFRLGARLTMDVQSDEE